VILGKIEEVIKSSIEETCDTYRYTLIQMEAMPDHLHVFLSAPPTVVPREIVRCLKSISANRVFTTFPYFWGSGLWSRATILALQEVSVPKLSADTLKPKNLPGRG
jgi:putative transposase